MSAKAVRLTAALLVLVALYTCWCGTPLIWDGAYQLVISLYKQQAYFYLTRFHSWVAWQPVVYASTVTENQTVLTMLYGLPFVLAPFVGVVCSWWFVRKHSPHLMIWVLFGILAAPLPGQIFIINDSLFQQHLFWPVFVGAFVPLHRRQWIAWWVLAIFQFSHPIGMPMLFGTGVGCALLWWFEPDPAVRRRHFNRAILLVTLGLLAAAKVFLPKHIWPWLHDTYAEQEFSLFNVLDRWRKGVAGWPIFGLVFFWAAGVFLFLATRASRKADAETAKPLWQTALACALIGGAMWVFWASKGERWYGALDYRRWLVPLTMPYFALAYLEILLAAPASGVKRIFGFPVGRSEATPAAPQQVLPADDYADPFVPATRSPMAVVLALVFTLVMCIQSAIWAGYMRRIERDAAAQPGPVIDPTVFAWASGTPAEHWGLNAQVVYLQGKTVSKMVIDDKGFDLMAQHPGHLPLCWFTTIPPAPGRDGWYDSTAVYNYIQTHRKPMTRPATQPVVQVK